MKKNVNLKVVIMFFIVGIILILGLGISYILMLNQIESIADNQANLELMQNIKVSLWEVFDEGDEQPTYILQWEYKNVYYELSGKISESEMENIAKNILY